MPSHSSHPWPTGHSPQSSPSPSTHGFAFGGKVRMPNDTEDRPALWALRDRGRVSERSPLAGLTTARNPHVIPFDSIISLSNSRLAQISDDGKVTYAAGGVASAMVPALCALGPSTATAITAHSSSSEPSRRARPAVLPFSMRDVRIPQRRYAAYYEGFANGVVWPLMHECHEFARPASVREWLSYAKVNRLFADAAVTSAAPNQLLWVHDYHLMLAPTILRTKLPESGIAYFHHIPFPNPKALAAGFTPSGVQALVEGLLGADLIGFHIEQYRRNFLDAIHQYAPQAEVIDDRQVRWHGRTVRLGDFPIGIDVDKVQALARGEIAQRAAERLRQRHGNRQIVLAVSRLDYSKGIDSAVRGFAQLLAQRPELRGKVVLELHAAPSRSGVPAYRAFADRVKADVKRVNAQFRAGEWQPVHLNDSGLPYQEVLGAQQAADIVLVNARRDGMNLVIKEAIAARGDRPARYVLGRGAGAASQLRDALLVNGHDPHSVAFGLAQALEMSDEEAQRRHAKLTKAVRVYSLSRWRDDFIKAAYTAATQREARVS